MKHLNESILSKNSGVYNKGVPPRVPIGTPYSAFTFRQMFDELDSRDYYYKMTEKEGLKFTGMLDNQDWRGAWKYLLDEVKGGYRLWFGDPVTEIIWIISVSSHTACVDMFEYSPNGPVGFVTELELPMNRNQKSWDGRNKKSKELIDTLLEK